INFLFKNVPQAFLTKKIAYREVAAPEIPRANFVALVETERAAPLRFRFLQSESGSWNKADAEALISQAVVADIARLSASGARLGERELKLSDMAVLVRSNEQAT